MAAWEQRSIEKLQSLLHSLASQRPLRHALMAIESGDGAFRWHAAAGESGPEGAPVQPDAPFFIASIDKLFTAVLVMQLAERGRVSLDAPVADYLAPELTRGLHCYRGVDYSGHITLRHLLGHTSGLADWLEQRPRDGPSLIEHILAEGDAPYALADVVARVRDRLSPHFPPQDPTARRQRIRYSDTNYVLLAAVIEAVERMPLHEVHQARILRPLAMRSTYFAGRSGPIAPTDLNCEGRALHIPRVLQSIGGIYSSTRDLLAFMRGFVRGALFENPRTRSRMLQRWNRFGLPLDRAALRAPAWPIEYALGVMRFRLPRILTPWRAMPAVIGHSGSTGCWLFHCPQRDLYLAGSVDEITAGAVPYRVVPRILRILDP